MRAGENDYEQDEAGDEGPGAELGSEGVDRDESDDCHDAGGDDAGDDHVPAGDDGRCAPFELLAEDEGDGDWWSAGECGGDCVGGEDQGVDSATSDVESGGAQEYVHDLSHAKDGDGDGGDSENEVPVVGGADVLPAFAEEVHARSDHKYEDDREYRVEDEPYPR